jgi:hypothetical protein
MLGSERTYTSQLESTGRRLLGHQFGGVFARDTLPPVLRSGHRGYIVNTDCLHDAQGGKPCGSGVHWLAVLDIDGERFMSDPLGRAGKPQRRDLNRIHRPTWSVDDAEMQTTASTCGPRSIAALAVGLSDGKDAFLAI